MLLAIPAASANSDNSKSTAGAGSTECRPGAGNHNVGSWELMDQSTYEATYLADHGLRADTLLVDTGHGYLVDGEIDTWGELIERSASATWEFCDKNRDGFACVVRFNLPSGSPYLILDNRPFRG